MNYYLQQMCNRIKNYPLPQIKKKKKKKKKKNSNATATSHQLKALLCRSLQPKRQSNNVKQKSIRTVLGLQPPPFDDDESPSTPLPSNSPVIYYIHYFFFFNHFHLKRHPSFTGTPIPHSLPHLITFFFF